MKNDNFLNKNKCFILFPISLTKKSKPTWKQVKKKLNKACRYAGLLLLAGYSLMWPATFVTDFVLLCLLSGHLDCRSYTFFLVYHLLLSLSLILVTISLFYLDRCRCMISETCGNCLYLFIGIGLFVAISCEGAAFSNSRSNTDECALYDNFGWTCVVTFIGVPVFGCFAVFGVLAVCFVPYMLYLVVKSCFEA